jgi:hypothetical protein
MLLRLRNWLRRRRFKSDRFGKWPFSAITCDQLTNTSFVWAESGNMLWRELPGLLVTTLGTKLSSVLDSYQKEDEAVHRLRGDLGLRPDWNEILRLSVDSRAVEIDMNLPLKHLRGGRYYQCFQVGSLVFKIRRPFESTGNLIGRPEVSELLDGNPSFEGFLRAAVSRLLPIHLPKMNQTIVERVFDLDIIGLQSFAEMLATKLFYENDLLASRVGKNVVPTRFGLIMVGNALLDFQVQVFVDGVPLRSVFDATTWEPYPSPQEVQNGLRKQMGEFLDVKGVDHNVDNFVWDPIERKLILVDVQELGSRPDEHNRNSFRDLYRALHGPSPEIPRSGSQSDASTSSLWH